MPSYLTRRIATENHLNMIDKKERCLHSFRSDSTSFCKKLTSISKILLDINPLGPIIEPYMLPKGLKELSFNLYWHSSDFVVKMFMKNFYLKINGQI